MRHMFWVVSAIFFTATCSSAIAQGTGGFGGGGGSPGGGAGGGSSITFSETIKVPLPGETVCDTQGWSVAIGQFDSDPTDNRALAATGCPAENTVRVYIEKANPGSGPTWEKIGLDIKLNSNSGEQFGHSVAINDIGEVFVGIPGYDYNGIQDSGAVFVYEYNTTLDIWQQSDTLISPDNDESAGGNGLGAQFGYSLASSDEGLAIGAIRGDSAAGIDTGKAYLFDRITTPGFVYQDDFEPNDKTGLDKFGTAVSIDRDRTGRTVVAVGSPRYDQGGIVDSGCAYTFSFTPGGPIFTQKFVSDAPELVGLFGSSIATQFFQGLGDNAGLAIGAVREDDGLAKKDAGAIHIFRDNKLGGSTNWGFRYVVHGTFKNSQLGKSVGLLLQDNDNALGPPAFMVLGGARRDREVYDNDPETGTVNVFEQAGLAWNLREKLVGSDTDLQDRFGFSLAIGSGYLIVGAPDQRPGPKSSTIPEGAGYIFNISGGDL